MPSPSYIFAALLLFAPPTNPRAGEQGPGPGTPQWHYSPFNQSMKEGHRRIREWRAQLETERRQRVQLDRLSGGGATPTGGSEGIDAPVPMGTEHTFAEGQLRGVWHFNDVTNETSGEGYGAGVRLDRTIYDPVNDKLFALTTERNLVEAPFEHEGVWTTRNQTIKIEKTGFAGVAVPAGSANNNEESFRLLGAIDARLYYSDDEGLTWNLSQGGDHAWYGTAWIDTMANGDILVQVRIDGDQPRHEILRSRDYGVSYQPIASWDDASTGRMTSTLLYNTDDTVIVVRQNNDNDTWEVYRYDGEELIQQTTFDSVAAPLTMTGTSFDGEKVYVGAYGGGGYYSDGGLVWEWIEFLPDRIESVHPNAPEVLFSHAPQHDYSLDGGWTWQPYPGQNENIGWDPKHLTFHEIDGEWVFVGANDMGLCFNEDPLDTSTWKYINEKHTYAILHGGVSVDHRGLTVTANQDPGTFELVANAPGDYRAINRMPADGLRVAASNDGLGFWFKHYWTSFYHAHAEVTGDDRVSEILTMTDDWYTPPFVSSNVPGEDSIYVSGEDQIYKLVYHDDSNWIQRLDLPTDFGGATGSPTYGIAIAKSDPSRIYVATRNGRFFYSKDYGESWDETSYNGPRPDPSNLTYNQSAGLIIQVADSNPDLVYFGGGSGESAMLISTDGGQTFTSAVDGLPQNASLGQVSLNTDGSLAFSANYYVYVAAEDRWYPMLGESMPTGGQPAALALNYLRLQNKLRYFTWGAGVLDFEFTHFDFEDVPLVSFEPEACHSLRLVSNELALTAAVDAGAGAEARQAVWEDTESQKWTFERQGGYFTVRNYASGDRLAVAANAFGDGDAVYAFDNPEGQNAEWNVLREPDGSYTLAARHTGKALSTAEGATPGTQLVTSTWFDQPEFKWTIDEVSCQMSEGETSSGTESDGGDESGDGDESSDTGPGANDGGSGCACSSESGRGGTGGLALLVLFGVRRRRRRA